MRLALKLFLALMFVATHANAFSLLGPYEDWMQQTNGYRWPSEIGGPMNLGEEYRWNVPVLTYGFDQSFLDYFGSNGVVAVEAAIEILNDLPSASSVVLTNYTVEPRWYNFVAMQQGLYDLKSFTLALLLEQFGLTEPTRNVFVLRRWDPSFQNFPDELNWWPGVIPYFILERNFDPETLSPSHYVNDTLLSGAVFGDSSRAEVIEFPVDPLASTYSAVADRYLFAGEFYDGLSRDDVGGIRQLLRTNNSKYETVLPGTHGVGTNATMWVNGALRPGIETITFVPHPYDSQAGQFMAYTNQFTDAWITNGTLIRQQVERVITVPDFLFLAADTGEGYASSPRWVRTGTSNWNNHAAANGNSGGAGPGVIQPPIRIMFHKAGRLVRTSDSMAEGAFDVVNGPWGTFNSSTNPSTIYPDHCAANRNTLTLRLRLWMGIHCAGSYTWRLPIDYGAHVSLQSCTNLPNWITITSVTNIGAVEEWLHFASKQQRFFRVVPN